MQITDVRVRKVKQEGENKLRANCSVVFDAMFVLHEVRVVQGANGLFVAMPRRRTTAGEYKDMAHPITAEAREAIQTAVMEAYQAMEAAETMVV